MWIMYISTGFIAWNPPMRGHYLQLMRLRDRVENIFKFGQYGGQRVAINLKMAVMREYTIGIMYEGIGVLSCDSMIVEKTKKAINMTLTTSLNIAHMIWYTGDKFYFVSFLN